jgi:hypothetical protein
MSIIARYFRTLTIVAVATATLAATAPARAQSALPQELTVQPTDADHDAALAAKTVYRRAHPANNAAGQALRARQLAARNPLRDGASDGHEGGVILQYPGDLTYAGGKVLASVVSHAIYLQRQPDGNCSIATCWGNPEGFLHDLGASEFIHLVDGYVGAFGANRYTVGSHATVNFTPSGPLLDTDIEAIVHAVASKTGAAGYGHIYHVFLPPGQDECFDSTLDDCYSPDNDAVWDYCAYHSSVDFPDIGHAIYTVEPHQDVPGCRVRPGSPNGSLVDSADNVLGHELFESITDPDGDAWTNAGFGWWRGSEAADECVVFYYDAGQGQYYYNVPTFLIGAHTYAVQLVYSNDQHTCSSSRD